MTNTNPTQAVNINFSEYVRSRKIVSDSHMNGGIPDYAYGVDYTLRQKLKAIPGMVPLVKAFLSTYVPKKKQELNLTALKVGPSQFPDVYEMVTDCARRLGIGIPTVYIQQDKDRQLNAYAMATEDDSPLIVITSDLFERFTPGELKTVIGHECGHIHNNHGIFNILADYIISIGVVASSRILPIALLNNILGLISKPIELGFLTWNRAAEVTCDRAGIICSDDMNDALTAEAKLLYGAAFNSEVNVDAVLKQYDAIRSSPLRFMELNRSHPLAVRRLFAEKEFFNSEVLYQWRPEWRKPDMELIGKQELDARCEKYISVMKK